MAESARVESLELLTGFQTVLWKFQAAANAALEDADSELRRTMLWLELEQDSFWQDQIRKRHTAVERAKEAVRMKKLFRDHSGRPQSAIEEQKELQRAMARLAEAQQKLANVRRWVRALQKEIELYKGSVQRLATSVESLVPTGVAHLERLVAELQAYAAISTQGSAIGDAAGNFTPSSAPEDAVMSRGTPPDEGKLEATGKKTPAFPDAAQRRNAPKLTHWPLVVPNLNDAQLLIISTVSGNADAPGGEANVTLGHPIVDAPLVELRQLEPESPDDSGWCVVPLNHQGDQWRSMTVTEIVRESPGWLPILKLPKGFSVIVNDRGQVTLRDPQGRELEK
jgi:hypothetical protein